MGTATAGFGGLERSSAGGATAVARILARAKLATDPLLRAAVETLPGELRMMGGYHFGWWDERGTPTRAESGKGLRPALVLAAARAAGASAEAALPAAVAVELVHNFTLIHDDVMDHDEMRHGRPTIWKLWGATDAILAGDALQGLAIRLLASEPGVGVGAIARLEQAVIELCLGQFHDCAFETRQDVTLDECLEVVRHKCGSLLGCACVLGALAAEAPPGVIDTMDTFGRELGIAFQLVDDLLGIWGDPARTGKPVGADLVRRKHSLPVVAALSSGTPAGRELAELYRDGRPMDPVTIARATDLVTLAGGKRWVQAESRRYLDSAVSQLANFPASGDLHHLAHAVVHRDR
ncbi:polyprenyl synthetase family protein [Nocardia sp. NEAU-G5]|uniref:Polyprenyl synthetase family protein n=1 Tax=Nocardia albiluteola TaxID=2842303 RepID=A0ABS6BDG6_9NOCA|nr:polyprenyl synthetase family protein [Nocardia albiluteola]MBU3067511.1 polyprenyl synthetase family protein [Nocardia albiluteola]